MHTSTIRIRYTITQATIPIYKNAIRRRRRMKDRERKTRSRRKFENNPRWPRRWTTNKRSNTWYSKVDSLVFLAEVSLKAFQCVSFSVYFLVFILFIAILCSGCCHTDSLSLFSSSRLLAFNTMAIQRQVRKKKEKIRTKGDNRSGSDGNTIGNSREGHGLYA